MIPLAYFVAIMLAEALTLLADIAAGAACHTFVMMALLAHTSWHVSPHGRPLLLSLALLPLTRVISFSLPLASFPAWSWPLLLSLPLTAAVAQVSMQSGRSWQMLLTPNRRVLPQLLFESPHPLRQDFVPGKGFFVIVRLYGPLEPFFEQTWRPDDIVKV